MGERVRIQYGGSVKPENAADLLLPAGHRRRADRRREPRAGRFRRHRVRGRAMKGPLVCLVILDGWGIAPPGPGNAVELAETPHVRRALGNLPAHPARCVGPGGRAAGGADGQLRGRPHEPRRRPGRAPGPGADRRRPRVRRVRSKSGAGGGLPRRPRCGAAPARAGVRRRRAQPRAAICRRCSSWPHGSMWSEVHVHAFTDGRDVSPTGGAGFLEGIPGVATVVRALLRHGSRPALGPRQACLRRHRARGRRARRRPGRGACVRATRRGSPTSSSSRS